MRQIGTLPDADQARALADYLLTRRIQSKLEPETEGWAVWICDEDQVPQAREELATFLSNPADPRYVRAADLAREVRRREERQEEQYRRRQVDLARKMDRAGLESRRWTINLIAACLLIWLVSLFKGGAEGPIMQPLFISSFEREGAFITWPSLEEIREGQVWRLVTPIFIHFSIWHLLFNVLLLNQLGGQVEQRRGAWRFLLLVVVLAVPSNLAQYYLGETHWDRGVGLVFQRNPAFGGMSGVLFGLFGYVWMKSRYEPSLGFVLHLQTVAMLIAWFFLCMTPFMKTVLNVQVANVAHAVGLLVGLAIGYAPTLWRSLRGR
jgi:GlpG protein